MISILIAGVTVLGTSGRAPAAEPSPSLPAPSVHLTVASYNVIPDHCIPSPSFDCPVAPTMYQRALAIEAAETIRDTIPSCVLDTPHEPTGTLAFVPGSSAVAGQGTLLRYRVAVEDGLAVDAECFAEDIERILHDERGWTGTGQVAFQRVETEPADFTIVLASPDTTNRLCAPLQTLGRYSCRNGNHVVINSWRWETGAESFGTELADYRRYLVNHEVGHRLGFGHRACPGAGEAAPVMMPQTKGAGSCEPNPWPTADELAALHR